jgi:enolase-phosphatase E1
VTSGPRVVLLDIEGTTTPVRFVYDVLFPYARTGTAALLASDASHDLIAALRREHGADPDRSAPSWDSRHQHASALRYVEWLMDRDRKSTALKELQGRVWERGFRDGTLRAEVYPDVPPALHRWRAAGRRIAIFSSGSVHAQKLLFAHTAAGDLTPLLDGYFDTTTGPKREAASYTRIAAQLAAAPADVLFVSDVAEELEAAAAAGMQVALCVREGDAEAAAHGFPVIQTFDAIP